MTESCEYERMLPKEFLEKVRACPVFFVPTGLLEWHGDHLPFGQDAMKAHGICLRAAEKLGGGIVLPPNYYGRPGYSGYVGTLTFSESLIQQLFYELFEQLQKVGAKLIYVLTGHYGECQVDTIKRAADIYQKEHPQIRIMAKPEYEGVLVDGAVPADHAGMWETSMFWSFYPELVRMERLKPRPEKMKLYKEPPHDYYHESEEWEWINPVEQSSPELGRKAVEQITDQMVLEIRQALEKTRE